MFLTLTQVAIGGAIGSVLRYLTVFAVGAPFATFMINVAGSFLMGVAYALLASRPGLSPFVMTGILGGFTTFSAFSLDAWKLWQSGQSSTALLYVAGSVLISLVAVALGAALIQRVLP